jgi:transcriptional regulator with XRE-family HTH domain
MSQEDLSAVSGLHRTEIGKIELGQAEPRLSTLLILADALAISLGDLVEGLPTPRERRPSPQSRRRS